MEVTHQELDRQLHLLNESRRMRKQRSNLIYARATNMKCRSTENDLKKLSYLFVAVMLFGCAGTWYERWMAVPAAMPNASFAVDGLPEYGQLSFENKLVHLFFTQCHLTKGGAVPGQLCGTLILTPGATVEFVSDEFTITDLKQHTVRTMKIQDHNFEIGVPYLGPDVSGDPGRWPFKAQKLYSLPGKRFTFMILPEPMQGDFEIRFASIKVNGGALQFPVLHVIDGPGRVWIHDPV
jgi:hypothetical protein